MGIGIVWGSGCRAGMLRDDAFGSAAFAVDLFVTAFVFAAVFFSKCLVGIGTCMPGIFICAIAGAEAATGVSALTPTNKLNFTIFSPHGRRLLNGASTLWFTYWPE